MRIALALIAVFVLSAVPARADVFVPADPPVLRSAYCSAAAGDVIAAGDGTATLRISVGGGGWHELPGLGGCPVVAGAADGTLAIAGSGDHSTSGIPSLVVRGAGGTFAAPVVLGGNSGSAPALAVAPGGWVAAAWTASDVGLTVLVLRPDGTSARAVLDAPSDGRDSLPISDPQVGIDARGDVTVLWRRYENRDDRLRVAKGLAGAAPADAADVPTGGGKLNAFAFAVAPGGGTLISWSTETGVRAVVDGQPAQVVDSTANSAVRLTAAVADGGTALLAYSGQGNELVAAERVGGSWLAPRLLAPGRKTDPLGGTASVESEQRIVATIAPGGRAAVVWTELLAGQLRVGGVAGQVGGPWTGATRLSSITRGASSPSLAIDAAGAPRASWAEGGLGVRGATLAPAQLDSSPPSLAARFPSRVPPTIDGGVELRVRVRCSEACDARARFALTGAQRNAIEGDENDGGSVVAAVPAGRDAVLRLRASDSLRYALIVSPRTRRLRAQVVVTDRAGNVTQRAATLHVRLLRPPLRTFRVSPRHKFGMETPAGDRAIGRLVNDMLDTVARGHVTDRQLERRYNRGMKAIARRFDPDYTYSEEVGTAIYDALWVPFARTHHDTGYFYID